MKYIIFSIVFMFCSIAQAQTISCGGPQVLRITTRFLPPVITTEAPVSGYNLFHGNISGQYDVPAVDVGRPVVGTDGVSIAQTKDFPANKDHFFVMTAYGPGGESIKSNEIKVSKTTTGPCNIPAPPVLKDAVIAAVVAMRNSADKLAKVENTLRTNATNLEKALNNSAKVAGIDSNILDVEVGF